MVVSLCSALEDDGAALEDDGAALVDDGAALEADWALRPRGSSMVS